MSDFYDLSFLKDQRNKIGDANFCAVVQDYLQDTIIEYLHFVYQKFPINNLCLSGGVAANIIMSLAIYERTNFKNIYVYPAMADDGLAIGSAILTAISLGQDIRWLSTKIILHVDFDDFIKTFLCFKPQRNRTVWLEIAWPSAYHIDDGFVWYGFD